ncbi:MAG: aminotransferase [Pseudomonadota bacterium]
MTAPVNPRIKATAAPPVMEARRWIARTRLAPDRPLLNFSQAAPVDPPPEPLRHAMAEIVIRDPNAHLYGPVLGLPELRAQVAAEWSRAYGAPVREDQVAITSGCNQAFTAAVATLARAGDAVILPVPWYFNHKMWLDMEGIETRVLQTGDDLLPDPERARALIDDRVKAIVLVTPNNPGGVEYPGELVQAFYALAKAHDLALLIDETYRDFDGRAQRPHDLFADPDWDRTLIQTYSFSKAYRLTGHRVGALLTHPARLAEAEKFLDSSTICPNQLGQRAALWGMRHLGDWLAGERLEILERRAAIEKGLPELAGWTLLGCGAYFAYVEHPFALPSDQVAQALLHQAGALLLPGTMFAPTLAEGGTGAAERQMRIAFANADRTGIGVLFDRLRQVDPATLAPARPTS